MYFIRTRGIKREAIRRKQKCFHLIKKVFSRHCCQQGRIERGTFAVLKLRRKSRMTKQNYQLALIKPDPFVFTFK